jgi:O-antigen ligase
MLQRFIAVLLVCHVVGFAFVSAVGDALAIGPGAASVLYRAVVLGLSLIVIIGFCVGEVRFANTRVWFLFLFFWAALLVRLLVDGFWNGVPLRRSVDEYLLVFTGVCLIPMIAMFASATSDTLRFALSAAFGACFVTACLLIWLLLTGGVVEWSLRLATETLNPISVGYVGAALVVLAAVHQSSKAINGAISRGALQLVRLAAYPLGLSVVFTSGSRGPLLALLTAFLARAVIAASGRSLGGVRVAVVIFVSVALLAAGALVFTTIAAEGIGPSIADRLASVQDESSDLRLRAAIGAMAQFADSPVFGSSMMEQSTMDYPHNMFLEALIATGIFGAIAYLVLFLTVLRAAVYLIRDGQRQWLGMLCVMQLVATLTSGSLYLTDTFWTLAAATVAAASTASVGVSLHGRHRSAVSGCRH